MKFKIFCRTKKTTHTVGENIRWLYNESVKNLATELNGTFSKKEKK
jgi:hypothetical protein